jgi:hypothetical protein
MKHGESLYIHDPFGTHVQCRPTMETLADIIGARRARPTLPVDMVDDIVARWGGLRVLIDLCYFLDGNWPSDPFGENPLLRFMNRGQSRKNQDAHGLVPSPDWIARFYKAVVAIWLYQEMISLYNIMRWECASALAVIRYLAPILCLGGNIRDCGDVIKAWNSVFVRLLSPPFQLGQPCVLPSNSLAAPFARNVLRPANISDLLILSTGAPAFGPYRPNQLLLVHEMIAFEFQLSAGICITRIHDGDSPDEGGALLTNEIGTNHGGIFIQLMTLFNQAGVGVRATPSKHNGLFRIWSRILQPRLADWSRRILSPTDRFTQYETGD